MKLPNQVLKTSHLGKQQIYWSEEDMRFCTHKGDAITIPARTISDGLSIPKIFQAFFSKSPYYIYAGLLHDYLYKTNAHPEMSRKLCDRIFRAYMKQYGVGIIRRSIIHRAVRLGGWASYKKQPITKVKEL